MKRAWQVISVSLFVFLVSLANSQELPTWQLVSTRIVATYITFGDQISNSGKYIAHYSNVGEIVNTLDLSIEEGDYSYWSVSYSPWLNGTVVFVPVRTDEPLPCLPSDELTLFRYDAASHLFDYICFETVPMTWDIHEFYLMSHLARSPRDKDILLAEERYLLDLQEKTVTDLQSVLSTQLDRSHMNEWVVHREIFWDPQNWYPIARIVADVPYEGIGDVTSQTLKICAMSTMDCDPIVTVEDYIHGRLSDYTVSSDGQTLLWSAIEYPTNESIDLAGSIGIALDVVAYATDIQSGATTQIFRLSDHSAISTSVTTQWSPDGLTLAVYVRDVESNELPPPSFVLMAEFEQVWPDN